MFQANTYDLDISSFPYDKFGALYKYLSVNVKSGIFQVFSQTQSVLSYNEYAWSYWTSERKRFLNANTPVLLKKYIFQRFLFHFQHYFPSILKFYSIKL